MLRCPNCNSPVRESDDACRSCGQPLFQGSETGDRSGGVEPTDGPRCPSCSALVSEGDSVCRVCGQALGGKRETADRPQRVQRDREPEGQTESPSPGQRDRPGQANDGPRRAEANDGPRRAEANDGPGRRGGDRNARRAREDSTAVPDGHVICRLCGEPFDASARGGWCTNPACGNWHAVGADGASLESTNESETPAQTESGRESSSGQASGRSRAAAAGPNGADGLAETDGADDLAGTDETVSCQVCGERFRLDAAGGWCTNPSCGEWRVPDGKPRDEVDIPAIQGDEKADPLAQGTESGPESNPDERGERDAERAASDDERTGSGTAETDEHTEAETPTEATPRPADDDSARSVGDDPDQTADDPDQTADEGDDGPTAGTAEQATDGEHDRGESPPQPEGYQPGDSVRCHICDREFDPTVAGGWCTSTSCGEWRVPGGAPRSAVELPAESGSDGQERPAGADADRANADRADTDPEDDTARAAENGSADGDASTNDPPEAVREFVAGCPAVDAVDVVDDGDSVHVYTGRVQSRRSAILALSPDADSEACREAFESSLRTWRGIDKNPHVATVVANGDDPRPWVAVAADTGPLATVVDDVDRDERIDVVRDIAEGLRTASMYNVVHAGIDPQTVVVDGGDATLAGWGVSRAVSAAADESLVTPFTAPEQLRDEAPAGPATDVYRLAAVAYALLTDREPVTGEDLETAIRDGEVPDPTEVADCPRSVADVLLTGLATDPADRHDSAYAFRSALNRALR